MKQNVEFEKQDAFTAAMIAAFDSGEIPEIYRPYMAWKRGVADLPSKAQAYEMMNAVEAQDDPSDYLTAISDELSTILQILK